MNIKNKIDILKILSEKFEEDAENKPKDIISDKALVFCVKGKTIEAKNLLQNFSGNLDFNINNLGFKMKPEDLSQFSEVNARYSIEYLEYFLKLLKQTSDNIVITMKRNYPIKMENEDFEVILAPRITEKD